MGAEEPGEVREEFEEEIEGSGFRWQRGLKTRQWILPLEAIGGLAESGFCTAARAEAFLQGPGRGGEPRSWVLSIERKRLLEDKQLFF